jgi:two-component system heavy metal sensor histidine kinase CusS
MPAEPQTGRPLSLALRTTAVVAAAMAALLAACAWWIGVSLQEHLAEQDLGELQAVTGSLATALASREPGDDERALQRRLAGAVMGHHGVYFNVWHLDGSPIYGTSPSELIEAADKQIPSATLDAAALRVWNVNGKTYRGAVLQLEHHRVMVAVLMDFHLRYLERLHRGLWLGTLAASLISVAAVWLAVWWGLAPLRRVSRRIEDVGSSRLHLRLDAAQVPKELEHLVAAFNGMLDRLQHSFTRLSDFSADIAHELRTPVTNLSTQTQVALSKMRTVEEYQELLYSSLEELDRMSRMIGDMLFLAQADHAPSPPTLARVDLATEARDLFEYFEALAEERGVTLTMQGAASAVRGDRAMLRRALSNLISNGLRHAQPGTPLTVRLVDAADAVEVSVENQGRDIPAEHLSRLFDRFYRVDAARRHTGEGAGLGLSIVKSIVQAHGGRVGATSGDGLTCFTFSLPRKAA